MKTFAFVCSIFLLAGSAAPAEQRDAIRKFDFRAYLIAREHLIDRVCEGLGEPIQHINVQYAELLKNGHEQAIVEATTCAMGNGGADIVEVFQLDSSGKPVSLPISDAGYKKDDLYQGQYRTPRLEAMDGKLIRWFPMRLPRKGGSESDEEPIRVITYRWSGKEFVIQEVEDVPANKWK